MPQNKMNQLDINIYTNIIKSNMDNLQQGNISETDYTQILQTCHNDLKQRYNITQDQFYALQDMAVTI